MRKHSLLRDRIVPGYVATPYHDSWAMRQPFQCQIRDLEEHVRAMSLMLIGK
jgi:hypothetical protein